MNKAIRLTIFTVIVLSVLAFYLSYEVNLQQKHAKNVRKLLAEKYQLKLAIVFESFFTEYHQWPCHSGPIEFDCWNELLGTSSAKINNRHIDFSAKNNVLLMTEDGSGHGFVFNPVKVNNETRAAIEIQR